MGSVPSQKDAASPATEAEVAAEAPEPQKSNQMPKDHHSDDNICVCDGASPSKKRRRAQSGEAERDPPVNGVAVSEEQAQESEEKVEASEENGHVEDENEAEKEQVDGDAVSNGIKEPEEQEEETSEAASEEVQVNGERVEEQEKQKEDTIAVSEMREMLQLMDQNGDEQISLREFVRYFAAGERDVATDMIDNGRKKELAALHVKRMVDLTPREEVDPIFAQLKNAVLQKEEPPMTPN
ncbi:hypothetical protein JG688_00001316, partial [Phytophthora aleatoria]